MKVMMTVVVVMAMAMVLTNTDEDGDDKIHGEDVDADECLYVLAKA